MLINDKGNVRGKIYYADRAGQLRDFSGLRWGKITPTDLDAIVDFHDRLWILVETKVTGQPLPYGQSLNLTRLVDIIQETNRYAILLVAYHDTPPEKAISVDMCTVGWYYFNKRWIKPASGRTVRSAIDICIDRYYPAFIDFLKNTGQLFPASGIKNRS